ncbi:MAG: alpha/beta hydrolase [Phycisphaerales bacterium]|nr:alpha/beta hydrolase [Phycisphaerales bacterium]
MRTVSDTIHSNRHQISQSPESEWTWVPLLGVRIHARVWRRDAEAPASVPLVLVAGLGVSSTYWVRFGRRMAGDFEVLAPDLPGFGRTKKTPGTPWPGGPDVREQADQLLAWMDARGLGRVALCGHSTGGQVAVEFANRHPQRAQRLILAAPTFAPGQRSVLKYIPRLLACSWVEAPSLTPMLMFEYLRTGIPRAFQQALRFIVDPVESKLPRITVPTLVIAGQYDLLVPQSWTKTIAARLPNAELVTIDNVGHAVQYSSAAVMAKLVRQFLRRSPIEPTPTDNVPSPADTNRRPAVGPHGPLGEIIDMATRIFPIAPSPVVVAADDPCHDPLGPPQPIRPRVHGVIDYAVYAAALWATRQRADSPRSRWAVAITAAAGLAGNAMTDHRAAILPKIPMLVHANAEIVSGLHLLLASCTYLRREPARRKVALLGLYQLAAATLTAKPTGPARRSQSSTDV